jgi:hypothetical protein
MHLGYRHFVVVGDDITRLSQKAFEALCKQQHPGLPAFAGTTVDLVTVLYVVAHRRPTALVRMECERWTIRDDGTLDAQDREERARLTRYQMDRAFRHLLPAAPHTGGTVIDARARFDEKRLRDTFTPTLSAMAMQKMIADIWREPGRHGR